MDVYKNIYEAIEHRVALHFRYHGCKRFVFPYALGRIGGALFLLAYQFDGESASGSFQVGALKNWRTFELSQVHNLELHPQQRWQRIPGYRRGSWKFDELKIAVPDFGKGRFRPDLSDDLTLRLHLSKIRAELKSLAGDLSGDKRRAMEDLVGKLEKFPFKSSCGSDSL